MKPFGALTAVLGLAGLAQAHMEMTYPAPFKSKQNPNAGGDIDYSMTSPLAADGSNFPCKGYQSLLGTAAGAPTVTWQAGQQYSMTIAGGADHGGGSCQASLSFDKGKTWKVIKSYIGNCPVSPSSTFGFTLPVDTPAGVSLFAWTWFNRIGNREMYMNCAAINVKAGSGTPSTPMSKRPAMFVANVANGCGTTETKDLMFPNPGPDTSVTSSNTAPPVGQCPAGPGAQITTTTKPAVVSTTKKTTTTKPPTKTTSKPGGVFITVSTLKTTTTRKTTPTPTPTKAVTGVVAPGTACKPEGLWNCVNQGTAFQRCASGTWSVVMPLAAGTKCTPGQSLDFVCDEVKPDCGRCKRLKIKCVGSGTKRWMFKEQSFQGQPSKQKGKATTSSGSGNPNINTKIQSPKRSPSNEMTRTRSAFVYILGVNDVRYDVGNLAGNYIFETPARIGSDPALDASVSALIASYNALRLKQSKLSSMEQYGAALNALRGTLQDPRRSLETKIQTVSTMYLCQIWIDRKHAEKHRAMLVHMLRDAVSERKLGNFSPQQLFQFCYQVIWQCLVDPDIQVGPWLWDALSNLNDNLRPIKYHTGITFMTVQVGTLAEAAFYLREPQKYLYQLLCMYKLLQLERPTIRGFIQHALMLARTPSAPQNSWTVFCSYGTSYGAIVALGSILNRVLDIFDSSPSYTADAHDFTDEAILLTSYFSTIRPLGAAGVPECLKPVWAANTDLYRISELEALILDYEKDFEGADYLKEASDMKQRLLKLEEEYNQAKATSGSLTNERTSVEQDNNSCVIL
ncbi:hypothetical protein NM208_g9701 [Fusarium decemcellulare]|uniref:Uncharacterized protein n=1 Tax=Fusarium decemcellulare TaxID=57161 RepID=A0ACC1S0K4_9HYPO|nr:hypothetical protein NM208_g9701 [Fusarium decemcellulare]